MGGVKGKVVIVTGASSKIGLATVQPLNRYGAKILACDIDEAPESVLGLQECRLVRVNLADVCAAEKVFEDAIAAFGRIDGLLNIAGIMDTNNSVDTLTDALWDRVISINLTAPVKLMRAVVSHMIRAGGGSILNVPSKVGTSGAIAGVTYTSRKHGIVGATENVAFEFREDRNRCNAISPGGVNTKNQSSIDQTRFDMGAMKFIRPVHTLGAVDGIRFAEPQMQANVLAFLHIGSEFGNQWVEYSC